LPLPARTGSTGSHHPNLPSDLLPPPRQSAESDIAQFLAHPKGGAGNTDDAPTVITKSRAAGTSPPVAPPPPVVVTSEPPSIAGRRLGHFELIEAIGAGGMAAVLKARDTELGRIVALKILPPEAARDLESVTRFKQEARAAAALDHDNVARVYYCGEDQGLHFIAFEFVEGDTLRQMIERRGVLPASLCVRYMVQVAAGLNHAAERGVVHRDVKPSNILITPDGRAKIVDMGLARQLGSEGVNGGVTQSGVTLGTFDYISPEQALDPRRADVRSDIYSLGCTFYHALTGRPPVPEGTAARKLRAHQSELPLDPRELNPAVPDELAAVLARMMAKDPARRYQTPIELIAHLKGLVERFHLGPDALANDSATRAVPAELHLLPEPPRPRPWWVLAAVGVAFAVVAVVVANYNPVPPTGAPGTNAYTKSKAPDPISEKGTVLPAGPPPRTGARADGPVTTIGQLVERLENPDPTTTRVVLAAGTFDFRSIDRPVSFQGRALELVGSTTGVTKVITCASPARGAGGSLTVRAENVIVRNVWFDMALDPEVDFLEKVGTQPVGLRFDEAVRVDLADCVFAATDALLRDHDPRSLAVTPGSRPTDPATRLEALRCLFAPAAVGAVVPAGAQVALTDCGFAPHSAGILIDAPVPGAADPLPTVRLEHSSFMLDPGACVVETGGPAAVQVTVRDCVFAPVNGPPRHPFSASDANRRGVIVRASGVRADKVQFAVPAGRTNAYYSVDAVGTPQATFPFGDAKLVLAVGKEPDGRTEPRARPWTELQQRPWAENRAADLAAGDADPWRAFRLRVVEPDADAALFTTDKLPVPLGAAFYNREYLPAWRVYSDAVRVWPPARPRVAVESRQKVWCPSATQTELGSGEFAELKELLKKVHPGDEILIRHPGGELQIDHEEIRAATKPSEGEMRLTFKPEPGSRPILVVKDDDERDQRLFKLKTGEVTFEGLHFRLKPKRDGQTVAAVSVIGGKGVTFRNCLFTLAEEEDSRVAAVHLPDSDKVMAMDPAARPVPKIVFDHCLVRGKGRAVWVEVSRPFTLDVTDTLTALDGPVICAEAGGKLTGSTSSTARFTRATALAGGPLVELHGAKAGDPKGAGLVKLDVEADECLFVAVPGAGRPLVEVDGVDPTDVKSVLEWKVKKPNRYANFEAGAVLAVIRPGGDAMTKEWMRDDWLGNFGELPGADKRFGTIAFAGSVTGLKDLATLGPADVVAKAVDFPDLSDPKELLAGAELKALPSVPTDAKPD
jgi:serine/threonine protein kinase